MYLPLGIACLLLVSPVTAKPSPVIQTQDKLKKLDVQINSLRQNLATDQDKISVLNKEIAGTEKHIGEGIRKLRTIQNTIDNKETKIDELQKHILSRQNELKIQQDLLANHIRARYQMGEYQPLKWVLNQDDPYRISRILTYYQYMVQSRQHLITQIDTTKNKLADSKKALHRELEAQRNLKNELALHQSELLKTKAHHTGLVKAVHHDIVNKEHTLVAFQKDKNTLSRLLKSLSQQSVMQVSRPFAQMRKKLPRPVQSTQRSMRAMNQGVTFFADEGTVVTAVYPGKVVFSDWLKGYGLLLIIDHGQGFMTLYAHNQSLFKHTGQVVNQNEQIASVGHSGGIRQNGLYFEIRVRGKAVSPMGWLA